MRKSIGVIAWPVAVPSLLGTMASVVVSAMSWSGAFAVLAESPILLPLPFGIFVVWLPTVLVSQRLSQGSVKRDFWKVVLRGAPRGIRWAVHGAFGY